MQRILIPWSDIVCKVVDVGWMLSSYIIASINSTVDSFATDLDVQQLKVRWHIPEGLCQPWTPRCRHRKCRVNLETDLGVLGYGGKG